MPSVKLSGACGYAPKAHKAACASYVPHSIAWRMDQAAAPVFVCFKQIVPTIFLHSEASRVRNTGCEMTHMLLQARAWR